MSDLSDTPPNNEEGDVERLLIEGLHAEPLSDAAMRRIRDVAAQEWRRAIRSRRRTRFVRSSSWAAAVAALVCLVFGATWLLRPMTHPALVGVVSRADLGEGEIVSGWVHHRALKIGSSVNVGDVLTSHGALLISLSAGGTLRVAPETVLKLATATETSLKKGRIYLEFPLSARAGAFDVRTRVGVLEHVGTEFEVLSNDQIVQIRVREGRVRLRSDRNDTLLEAGTQWTANQDGTVTRSAVTAYGRDWLWVAALAPDYEIEGRPLLDFLQWAARELGRAVKFSDSRAREVAEHTILHGSVKGRDPMDALSSVLATTSLTYEIRGDTIWIQSGP